MSKPGDRKMDRSQLPLLRKKKTSKETAAKDKDTTSTKKDKAKAFQTKPGAVASTGCLATSSPSLPREEGSSPGGRKDLGTKPKRDDRVPVNGNGVDLVVDEEDGRKPRTPIDWEWSKYVVRGGQPSDAYQKYGPEKSVPVDDIQGKAKQVPRRTTGLTPPKPQYSQLPHLTGQQYFSGKLNSLGDYSPTTALHLQEDPRLPSSANGKSSHPQVFTFDQKHFDDHDSSPIYHELDPLGVYNPSAHHTYQSITEIKEEVNRLQAEAAAAARGPPTTVQSSNNNSGPTQSASGPTRSSLKPDSGTPRSPATLDVSPKRRSSKTLPAHLTRVCAPRSPTLLPAPSSPTVPGQQGPTRAQSIFSKLWQQKKPAAQVLKDSPSRNGDHASSNSASARNLSLGDVRLDSPTTERNFSSLYAITSPPPSAATAMTDYYRRLTGNQGVATSPLSPTSAYGMAACKNLLNFYGSAKRSFSDSSSTSNSLGDRGKAAGKSGVAYENRLPWRNCRDLSPVNGKSYADRWDIVRFGEPLDSPVSGGGNVSLETFKTKKSSPKPNKACSSSPCYQCPGKPQSSASPSKKDSGPVAKKTQQQKGAKRTEATNGRAQEIDRFPDRQFPISRTMTNMSCLSKSQENVLSAFPLDLFTTSPPGSFESLLSEDDVFLPSSNERLNLLSPPLARTTFSSPSCGVRMAELRAVRRKSDSKSPSPEPPVSTPPPYLPFFQVTSSAGTHRPPDPVTKQDVAVQTSPIRSPVRLGKNSHRYMHTIIEEDHLDQGHSTTDGKQPGVRCADPKTKTMAPGSSRVGNVSVHGRPALSVFRREMDAFGKEEEEEEEEETAGNLLEIISEDDDDDDNSSLDSSSGKIRLSNISCSAGNGQDGDRGGAGTGRAATDDDRATDTTRLLPPAGPPQPVQPTSSELSSLFSDLERSSQTSGVSVDSAMDCRSAGSKPSATSEAERSIPSSVQDVESVSKRPSRESGRSKGSKLRPPKPAKCIAPRTIDGPSSGGATVANQQRDDVSELPRYSTQYVKAKVTEARPLTSPRQLNDPQPTDTTRTQPIIKEAAVRCIESIGTSGHDNKAAAVAAVDTKSCDQQAVAEVPRTAPTVPLKSGRGASQEKSPIALRTRIPGEQKKNVPSSKSQPSISSTSGVRGRIIDGALPDATPDCSSSSGSQSGSQSLPSKGDSALTNRNSSLSSSLTSSSSSSLFSVADSESENVGRPRKDPLISITRPGDFKSSPPADRLDRTSTGKTGKPGPNDGKGLEKSRLAIPRVSVTRCKDRFEKTLASKQDTPTPPLTSENFCDVDDKNKFYSTPASSDL